MLNSFPSHSRIQSQRDFFPMMTLHKVLSRFFTVCENSRSSRSCTQNCSLALKLNQPSRFSFCRVRIVVGLICCCLPFQSQFTTHERPAVALKVVYINRLYSYISLFSYTLMGSRTACGCSFPCILNYDIVKAITQHARIARCTFESCRAF